jgi:hypothetical protein
LLRQKELQIDQQPLQIDNLQFAIRNRLRVKEVVTMSATASDR